MVTFLLGSALLAASAGAQEAPHLLADINRTPHVPFSTVLREEPKDFFNLGGRLLFSTADLGSLDQGILWSTDGTAQGTRQLSTALCLAFCESISALTVQNGVALLRVVSQPNGLDSDTARLGRTDGTPEGTYLLTGYVDSESTPPLEVYPLPGGGTFLFPSCPPYEECRLWRSDGTRSGTGIFAGTDALPFIAPHAFSLWHGSLYFVALHGEGGEEGLWSTDGTPAGTLFLHAAMDLGDSRARTVITPSHLFFTSGEAGEDLWATDGTPAGTRRVADFAPQDCPLEGCLRRDVDSLTASGDRVYFEIHRTGHAIEIWESDGTPEGTQPRIALPARVFEAYSFQRVDGHWLFLAATEDSAPVFWSVDDGFTQAKRLSACGGEICPVVYFSFLRTGTGTVFVGGSDPVHGYEPWITDGTAQGTRRLGDICPGGCWGLGFDPKLLAAPSSPSGETLFRAFLSGGTAGTGQDELWATDGTPTGTHRVAGHTSGFGILNGLIYYGSSFGSGGQGHIGSELWATDGTAGSTRRIASLRRFEPGSAPVLQTFQDGALILTAKAEGQAALWKSDGTPAGTFSLHDFSGDAQRVNATFISPVRSFQLLSLYVEPTDFSRPAKSEIWRADGTPGGTRFVATLPPSGFVEVPVAWNGKLVFDVYAPSGCGLWSSDGTVAGTHPILPTASIFHCPQVLTALGSRFLYSASYGDGQTHSRLFLSDGTVAGTQEIARFGGVFGQQALRIGGTVFFRVVSDSSAELWQTDGTAAGTRRSSTLAEPSDLQEFAGSLYLTAAPSAADNSGRALFRLSATGGDPILLARLFRYRYASLYPPVQFAHIGDRLLFTVQDQELGLELWGSDGTPDGTQRLRRFERSPDLYRNPEILAAAGDRVFFAAGDGVHGRELWESDGTREGTRMVIDLAPGGFSSMPQNSSFAVANGFLFFAADDSKTGLEPWALPLEPR